MACTHHLLRGTTITFHLIHTSFSSAWHLLILITDDLYKAFHKTVKYKKNVINFILREISDNDFSLQQEIKVENFSFYSTLSPQKHTS